MPVNKNPEKPDVQEVTRDVAPTEPVKQDKPVQEEREENQPQSYVWLADGSVLRVNDEDLPGASGVFDAFGHWQRGNKVYMIVAVYPVETVVKEQEK